MISLLTDKPLKDAVDVISRKVPVGSGMSSAEWEGLSAEIRLRSMFSARVEEERILVEMQERLAARISLEKRDGRTMDRGVFIEEIREELRKSGYKRGDDVKRGSLRDLKSTRRLGLIWDMNVAQAQGYARWKADMTEEGLDNEPCYELIRVMNRMETRKWPMIWAQAGGRFYDGQGSNDDYPDAPGRMIAKKTDPIWKMISRFNTPWPPYDWGSGMGLRGVDRDESDALGATSPNEIFAPLKTPFNEGVKASLRGIPENRRKRLLDAMHGDVEIIGDDIAIRPAPVNVPAVTLFPVPVNDALRDATAALSAWPEGKLRTLLDALEQTVAWPRYRAALRAAGAEPREHEALVRAMAQFMASPAAREAMMDVRMTTSRDAFWSPADFQGIRALIGKGGDQ